MTYPLSTPFQPASGDFFHSVMMVVVEADLARNSSGGPEGASWGMVMGLEGREGRPSPTELMADTRKT